MKSRLITMIKTIDDLITKMITYKIAEIYQILGCTCEEIEQIEQQYGVLPNSYKQIMKTIGRRAGKLVNRYEFNFYIDQIAGLNKEVLETRIEAIEEGEKILDLPDNIFFITSRYGDNIEFILTGKGEDSPVYGYGFPYNGTEEIYTSVWDWIESFIEDAKNMIELTESSQVKSKYNY